MEKRNLGLENDAIRNDMSEKILMLENLGV